VSDEDRLRDRLHDRAARVPDLSDIDDVAARLGRRRPVRERRLLALVALALVAGIGIGVAIGRDDGGRTLAVGSVGGTAETTAAPTTPTTPTIPATTLPGVARCDVVLQSGDTGNCVVPSGPLPTLPEPGPEQPADPSAARQQVKQAVVDATDGASSNSTRAAAIEGGDGLIAVFDELHSGPYGEQVRSARAVVDGIVFTSPTAAAVKFHADLADGSTSGPYYSDVVRDGVAWRFSRASYCEIVKLAGVHCPG